MLFGKRVLRKTSLYPLQLVGFCFNDKGDPPWSRQCRTDAHSQWNPKIFPGPVLIGSWTCEKKSFMVTLDRRSFFGEDRVNRNGAMLFFEITDKSVLI